MGYYGLTGGCEHALVYPTAPVDFTATADVSDPIIVLEWDDTDADYEVGKIEYSLDEVIWTLLDYFELGFETYSHEDLEYNTQYFYRISVHKRASWSEYSKDDDTTAEDEE
jgi:hypothetical protein